MCFPNLVSSSVGLLMTSWRLQSLLGSARRINRGRVWCNPSRPNPITTINSRLSDTYASARTANTYCAISNIRPFTLSLLYLALPRDIYLNSSRFKWTSYCSITNRRPCNGRVVWCCVKAMLLSLSRYTRDRGKISCLYTLIPLFDTWNGID